MMPGCSPGGGPQGNLSALVHWSQGYVEDVTQPPTAVVTGFAPSLGVADPAREPQESRAEQGFRRSKMGSQ